jgi:D-lactate dehydrogenase
MTLHKRLATILPNSRILSRPIDLYSYARDASFYRLIPRVIVQPRDTIEIKKLLHFCQKTGTPMTFRAAGTSLSGQSLSDSILVEINQFWKDYEISEDASSITLEPGIVGAKVNAVLKPFKRIIGPDPASINACFIGGIVANNASGMSSGVTLNSNNTLLAMQVILVNGVELDSSLPDANEQFKHKAPKLYNGLLKIRERILKDKALTQKIRDKFSRKNTTGYALDAFVSYENPIDILVHLMIGSEGTLGFISKVTLRTLPDQPFKSAALLLFKNMAAATDAVFQLKETKAQALEIMDRSALRSVQDQAGMPKELRTLPATATALLCEYQAETPEELDDKVNQGRETLKELDLLYDADFTQQESRRLLYWKVRKGLLPSAGAMRQKGTTVLIEDVGFRLKDLTPAILDLQELFKKHEYDDAVIFGHTEAGNIHFIISPNLADKEGLAKYKRFMDDVVDLTVNKYDGALKTEHGTGRNMAPFVKVEWGEKAYDIMKEIKTLFDPQNNLNPGVIINNDPECHIKNVKKSPVVHDEVDKCIECGFCEVWCPSKDLTTTPRRRIAALREIALLNEGSSKDRKLANQVRKDYTYEAVDTCAVDGLCALGCPVDIDTGNLTRFFREQAHSPFSLWVAQWTVNHFGFVVKSLSAGLKIAGGISAIIRPENMNTILNRIHKISKGKIPAWNKYMPTGAQKLPRPEQVADATESIIYFPSCLSRGMGTIPEEKFTESVPQAMLELSQKARVQIIFPKQIDDLCCGTPYSSKGFSSAYMNMAERVINSLYETSQEGEIPVVIDTSPCSYKIKHYDDVLTGENLVKWKKMQILDIVEYLHDHLLFKLMLKPLKGKAILHPTCSNIKMDLEEKMQATAKACCEEAEIPPERGCCGFAGDRGFLIPELTQSATIKEAMVVRQQDAGIGHYSTSRTCEIGMSSGTQLPYSSIIHLLKQASDLKEKNE